MKKFLLSILCGGVAMSASAVLMLPAPELAEETLGDGNVKLTWNFSSEDAPNPIYHVIVYKMHVADQPETFVLAQSDFEYIESKGTMKNSKYNGDIWAHIEDCPGYYVKFPMYMNHAMGIDTFQYFAGSDNDDVFGGAYMISPDYDLRGLTSPTINIKAELANEAVSVSGGFTIWTWNTDWWDEKNIDYKPVVGQDYHFDSEDGLSNEKWTLFSADCEPDEYLDRVRIMFYGVGYSTLWINNFRATVEMATGDRLPYNAEMYVTDKPELVLDTTADTDNDYTYAYQVRAVRQDKNDEDSGRELIDYIRFVSHFSPMKVIGADVDGVTVPTTEAPVRVTAANGVITISGADSAAIYTPAGVAVFSGSTEAPVSLAPGVYIVKANNQTVKVVL